MSWEDRGEGLYRVSLNDECILEPVTLHAVNQAQPWFWPSLGLRCTSAGTSSVARRGRGVIASSSVLVRGRILATGGVEGPSPLLDTFKDRMLDAELATLCSLSSINWSLVS